MNPFATYVFSPERARDREQARRLSWLTIVLLGIAGTLMLLTSGQSQTMKTAWITDLLSIVPPIAQLVAMRIELRPPSERFPYGYTRAISISFLVTAAVLSLFGITLFLDAVLKLVRGERPPIGTVVLLGHQIWAGWTMIVVLAFSLSCGFLVGRLKLPVAHRLLDRALAADAKMNHDEWMSEGAAIAGLLLVAFGFWWGDAGSAAFISLQILRDAWETIQQVVADLMDESPNLLDRHQLEDLPQRLRAAAAKYDWVADAAVRLREHGHLITGDIFVVPRVGAELAARIEGAAQELATIDWRLHALTVTPVARLERNEPEHPG